MLLLLNCFRSRCCLDSVFSQESGRKQSLSSEVLMGDKGDTGLGENPVEQEETQMCVFLLLPRPKAI